jgi:hypothetical protein
VALKLQSSRYAFAKPWPEDIVSTCPRCGSGFETRVNLECGPGKLGRTLKAISYGMIVPWMIIGTILGLNIAATTSGALNGGYAILGIVGIPPLLLAVLGNLMPRSRRVRCAKCDWGHDYPAQSTPVSSVD